MAWSLFVAAAVAPSYGQDFVIAPQAGTASGDCTTALCLEMAQAIGALDTGCTDEATKLVTSGLPGTTATSSGTADCASLIDSAERMLVQLAALAQQCANESHPTCATAVDLARSAVTFTVGCVNAIVPFHVDGGTAGASSTPDPVDCAALVQAGADLLAVVVALAQACANESDPTCATALSLARGMVAVATGCAAQVLNALGVQPIMGAAGAAGTADSLVVDCGALVRTGQELLVQLVALAQACANESNPACAAALDLARQTVLVMVGCIAGAVTALGVTVQVDGGTTLPVTGTTVDCGALVRAGQALLGQLAALATACVNEADPTCATVFDLARAAAAAAVGCLADLVGATGIESTAGTSTPDRVDCGALVDQARVLLAQFLAVAESCARGDTPLCATVLDTARDGFDLAVGCLSDVVASAAPGPASGIGWSTGGTACQSVMQEVQARLADLVACLRDGTGCPVPLPTATPSPLPVPTGTPSPLPVPSALPSPLPVPIETPEPVAQVPPEPPGVCVYVIHGVTPESHCGTIEGANPGTTDTAAGAPFTFPTDDPALPVEPLGPGSLSLALDTSLDLAAEQEKVRQERLARGNTPVADQVAALSAAIGQDVRSHAQVAVSLAVPMPYEVYVARRISRQLGFSDASTTTVYTESQAGYPYLLTDEPDADFHTDLAGTIQQSATFGVPDMTSGLANTGDLGRRMVVLGFNVPLATFEAVEADLRAAYPICATEVKISPLAAPMLCGVSDKLDETLLEEFRRYYRI